jgi:hypothetical protein
VHPLLPQSPSFLCCCCQSRAAAQPSAPRLFLLTFAKPCEAARLRRAFSFVNFPGVGFGGLPWCPRPLPWLRLLRLDVPALDLHGCSFSSGFGRRRAGRRDGRGGRAIGGLVCIFSLAAGFGREVRHAGAKNSLGALVERGLRHCSWCNTHQYDATILIWFRWLNHICFLVNLPYLLFCKSANHIPALFPAASEIFGLDS